MLTRLMHSAFLQTVTIYTRIGCCNPTFCIQLPFVGSLSHIDATIGNVKLIHIAENIVIKVKFDLP